MPRNGSGTYTLPAGNPVVTGTTISSTTHNATLADIVTALTNSLAKDGQTPATASIPFANGLSSPDNGFVLSENGDATKRLQFELSGISTATTRTLTAPDKDGTIATVIDAFSTGDVKLTVKTVADTGWVLMNDGTIGNAASGGTTRANADTVALYTLLWNNTANADCAVSTGRGANAAADYAANKTIALPKALGRALATYGAGATLTARALAAVVGAETHVLSTGEMPAHTHTAVTIGGTDIQGPGSGSYANGTSGSAGGGGAHNNMQPTVFLNVMIKL